MGFRFFRQAKVAPKATLEFRKSGAVVTVGRGRAPGPLREMPQDGLEVGRDEAGLVGTYSGKNEFGGTIEQVGNQLEKSGKKR